MEWIVDNAGILTVVASSFVAGGLAVAKLTKNKTDDKVFGLLKQVLDFLKKRK